MANTEFGATARFWHAYAGVRPLARGADAPWARGRQAGHGALPAAAALAGARGFRPYRDLFKRLLDVALIVLALPIVLPLIALLALLVAGDGHNPFYQQERVGRGGRIFRIWKLRTMVPDAERILQRHLRRCPASRREWETNQKLQRDPRVTAVGAVLRRISFDELPQLWNVLKGDMSLVGPRPMLPAQQALYPGTAYYALRPGLTGFWQISERNRSTFADRALFDDAYAAAVSLATDVRVLLRTVGVVLRGTGV